MSETTITHSEHFVLHLADLGYPASSISTYEHQRLSGDWDRYYEIHDPDTGQWLAVVGQIGTAASIESYAANLSYMQDREALLLSGSEDAGIQGFLVEPGRDGELKFFRVGFSDSKAGSAEVEPISEFPLLARLKSRYKRGILSQQVMATTAVIRPRNRDAEKSYQRFNKYKH